jgi:hypothetical protein
MWPPLVSVASDLIVPSTIPSFLEPFSGQGIEEISQNRVFTEVGDVSFIPQNEVIELFQAFHGALTCKRVGTW